MIAADREAAARRARTIPRAWRHAHPPSRSCARLVLRARSHAPPPARLRRRGAMHPPLFQPHPLCEGEVKSLVQCHEEHYVAKFWGACNDAKYALDMCFRVRRGLWRRW